MIRIVGLLAVLMFQFGIHAGVSAAAPAVGDTMTERGTGMDFVWVPQGCFQPGNLSNAAITKAVVEQVVDTGIIQSGIVGGGQVQESNALDDALNEPATPSAVEPVFIDQAVSAPDQVDKSKLTCINKGFWMAKYEVTQGQYHNIMGVNPSGFKKGDDYPVERVRWFDARKFIRRLNKVTGNHFRLPSEAEWEYAARSAGRNQTYGAAGNASQAGWYMSNSDNSTHPVGQKKANALGLNDMSGNVWEWTADCWNESPATMPKDGSVNKSGNCAARVLRGGSWYDAKALIKTTSRLWNDTDKFDNNSGFRLVHD